MKAVTPEGYTFVTKFQEDNSHKVLRSVDFFSIKFDEIFFDTVCWVGDRNLFLFEQSTPIPEKINVLEHMGAKLGEGGWECLNPLNF